MPLPNVFRFSRWVHTYEKEGVIAIFHALNIDVIFASASIKNIIYRIKHGTTMEHIQTLCPDIEEQVLTMLSDLHEREFIISMEGNDELQFEEKKRLYTIPPGVETLYLLLSDACNMRCSYCFILNGTPGDYNHKSMTKDVAMKAVDIFFENISRNSDHYINTRKTIIFYGGEPLINFSVLKTVVEYVESTYRKELDDIGNRFVFSIITNGTLINDEIASYIASNTRIAITVSLDGVEWVNDQKRIYKNGKGTFKDVLYGLQSLRKAGCTNISLSCTVDYHNIDHLDKILDLHDEYHFISINLNPLLDTEAGLVSREYTTKVNKKIISYYKKAREKGVYEDRMMRKIRPFLSGKIHMHDCQATGHQIVCSPDGKLGLCQEGVGMKNYFFADVTSGLEFHKHPVISEWNARSPLNMPQCRYCPAVGVCGGGCAYGAQLRNGSIWSVDDRFCTHSLSTLEWILWDLYEKTVDRVQSN